jgi:phytoene dehydrogenase-like protein
VTSKHFDVIVLGRSIGALTAAALLARRNFTVLVLGQGERGPSYRLDDHVLIRRSFTLLGATSPIFRKVTVELAQSQTWKRRVVPLSPMLQILSPRRRFDIPPDMVLFGREIDRELPEIRRLVEDLYAELARVNGAADEAFENDAVWPPGTFWERRETGRYASLLPHARAEPDADLLAEFPTAHPFRQVLSSSVAFACDLSTFPPPFAVARLHGAWTRGVFALPRGEEELEEILVDRILAHGGLCLFDDRASSIRLRGGVASAVKIDGDEDATGAGFVIADGTGEDVASLAGGEGIHKRAQREWPRVTSSVGRFVVSLIVRREGLPEPLGAECLLLPGERSTARPLGSARARLLQRPSIHLQRARQAGPGEELLVAEMLLHDRGPPDLGEARQAVLDVLLDELPFLERHLVVVDSVHDGLPVWVYEGQRRRSVDRAALKGAALGTEPMVRKLEVDPPGYLGVGGEPIRGPVSRSLLVGRSVLPGLGQEGQLLASWGAARLVTRSDRQKERMRRDMWSRIELG